MKSAKFAWINGSRVKLLTAAVRRVGGDWEVSFLKDGLSPEQQEQAEREKRAAGWAIVYHVPENDPLMATVGLSASPSVWGAD